MNSLLKILRALVNALGSSPKKTSTPGTPSPGQRGREATVEVSPRSLGPVTVTYVPHRDGAADPGEVVWTWVPFEENDGRGKDRPVLIVAALPGGDVLAVQLTSKEHAGGDYLSLGAGPWDAQGRPSWVILDRVFRVRPGGMRREAASLDRKNFDRVASALRSRYGWR
ncbi:type II toxin-antitoxin system PemK/MazF family toxin [Mycetocola spongiae]|uniref:type II toxin-antitoxin system PemK/MazF family toxin n=1 Tax=Mycetocola spongiae TaxID=2859226 RepID=UPI001CF4A737|nr:type II toxin-antitoxin system PemK/MazF family toxin [Mycetocola spongiae]